VTYNQPVCHPFAGKRQLAGDMFVLQVFSTAEGTKAVNQGTETDCTVTQKALRWSLNQTRSPFTQFSGKRQAISMLHDSNCARQQMNEQEHRFTPLFP
jgi:hypothetical protein